MALKRRFAERTEALVAPAPVEQGTEAVKRTPATAPGQMLAFRAELNEATERIEELEGELRRHEGSLPAVLMDPKSIRPSGWMNRHQKSFETPAFQALKADIALAGGNVQPIKVRGIAGRSGEYEVVFGLRRHRACLELGLPVRAVVVEIDDTALFAEMDRENRLREDLSPYETGLHYRAALDRKLWPSARKMAEALGVSPGLISQALVLAGLPTAVVGAFSTPLDIQYRWGRALAERLQADPDGVLARARALAEREEKPSAADTFNSLMDLAKGGSDRKVWPVEVGGRVVAQIKTSDVGISVQFDRRVAKSLDVRAVEEMVRALVADRH